MAFRAFLALCLAYSGFAASGSETPRRLVSPTPPMGWNSWNLFENRIHESLIREIAESMVRSGMKDAGYQYVCIDDSWQIPMTSEGGTANAGRDEHGILLADPEKFPRGIKSLADYVHSLGLKFGIYTSPGIGTCQGRTASRDHESIDIQTFADWGVDYIKLDFCGKLDPLDDARILSLWRNLLNECRRPVILSVNTNSRDYAMIRNYADLWRTTGDICAKWDAPRGRLRHNEVAMIIRQHQSLYEFHGPNTWCDPDMLEVGNGALTEDENRSHFSMWAMLAAPLITGNDLRTMTPAVRDILTNPEVIAIDQDPLGQMARKVREDPIGIQIWTKRLLDYGAQAAALLNLTDSTARITLSWNDLGISGAAFLLDLWAHRDLGLRKNCFTAEVPAHGVVLLKITACEDIRPYSVPALIPPEGIVLETEDHFGYNFIESKMDGYSGWGYVKGNVSVSAFWFFVSAEEIPVRLEIRYSNPTPQTNRFQIGMPGKSMQTIAFPPTLEAPWQSVFLDYQIRKGNNQIYLITPEEQENDLALDCLIVVPRK